MLHMRRLGQQIAQHPVGSTDHRALETAENEAAEAAHVAAVRSAVLWTVLAIGAGSDSQIVRKVLSACATHLVHVVIAVIGKPPDEPHVPLGARQRFVSVEQRGVLRPGDRIKGLSRRLRVFAADRRAWVDLPVSFLYSVIRVNASLWG